MVFIPVPQTAQCVVQHLLDGEEVNNVLNFFSNTPYTQESLTELADELANGWRINILPSLSGSLTMVGVTARDMSTQEGIQVFYPVPAETFGGQPGEPMPANVAVVMTHRTAQIGRTKRGRTFFGGLSENRVSGNNVSNTTITDLTLAFNSIKAGLAASGFLFVVVSRFFNKAPRPVAVTTIVTSSAFRNSRVDSQRGRLPS